MTEVQCLDLEATCWTRSYSGDYAAHIHDHTQILFALEGRLELEIAGRCTFADTSCGVVIPAGVAHAFRAAPGVRMVGFDAPESREEDRVRRFAVNPKLAAIRSQYGSTLVLRDILDSPRIFSRRGIDLDLLSREVESRLHETWSTERMARLFFLSGQRFHARFIELTGRTPQAHVKELRLNRASEHIRQGLSLQKSAQLVGYCSASSLGFALRRDKNVGARSLRGLNLDSQSPPA